MSHPRVVLVAMIAVLLLASTAVSASSSTWPQYHGTSSGAGYTDCVRVGDDLRWSVTTSGGREAQSAVIGDDGTVYVCSLSGLVAVAPDGTPRWKYGSEEGWGTPAVSNDGTIYFVSGRVGGCWALNAVSPEGELQWACSLGQVVSAGIPRIDANGNVYVAVNARSGGGTGGSLCSISPFGALNWQREIAESSVSQGSVAIDSRGLVYVAANEFGGAVLVALDAEGNERQRVRLSACNSYGSPAVSNGRIYIGTCGAGNGVPRLHAIDGDGNVLWASEIGKGMNGAPAVIEREDGSTSIYAISEGGTLWAFSGDGELEWRYDAPGITEGYFGSPVVDGAGVIYYTGRTQACEVCLVAVDPNGGELGRIRVPNAVVSTPAIGAFGEIHLAGGTPTRIGGWSPGGSMYASEKPRSLATCSLLRPGTDMWDCKSVVLSELTSGAPRSGVWLASPRSLR